jgi:imidazolonepropionase
MSAESQAAMRCDRVWRNARVLTLANLANRARDANNANSANLPPEHALRELPDALVACRDGRIVYVGAREAAPALEADESVDCAGRLITPGLIDCHTHLVHAGDRAHEFERRLNGESYESIARSGGGILSTVQATRAASEAQLLAETLPRLDALLSEGVTTVEIKSGYGLALAHEHKQLTAARRLGQLRAVTVRTTFLGAHALPPEYAGQSDAYVRDVCEVMLPQLSAAGLIDAVDVFCEHIGFSLAQTERVLRAAKALKLEVKLHAEQLSNSHGAKLAASLQALSADHLEHLDAAGIAAMARAGTTAVLLPGAYYFMRETRLPPIAELRAQGVPIAIASDCNPGTSPISSPLLIMNMAATLFRMTVAECLWGMTQAAARALGLADRVGSLEVGKDCDLAIWNVARAAELVYRIGAKPLHARVWRGR